MDGRAHVIYAVNNGFWFEPDESGSDSRDWARLIGTVKIGPGWASDDIIDERGRKTGFKWDFIKVGDRWTFDWKRADAYLNQSIEATAAPPA